MNKCFRKALVFVVAAVMLLPLAACTTPAGTTAPATAPPQTSSASPDVSQPKDPFEKHDPIVTIHAARKSRAVIKFIDGEDYTNNAFSKEVKSRLGIDVQYDWIVDESQYEARVNLMITSGEIPDCFHVTASQEQQLVDEGLIMDLTDLVDQYGTSCLSKMIKTDPQLYKTLLTNGRLYDIPGMPSKDYWMNELYVRKDWLDNVGLPAPKTAEDLEKVLDAFVNQDPDKNGQKDTIGIGFNKDLTQAVGVGDIGPMFAMFKAYPTTWIKDAAGKLVYGSILPEVKTALQYLQDLYKKGLIDPEFAVKDQSKVAEDIVAERLGLEFGVFWTPSYPWNDLVIKNPKAADLLCLDIPSRDGQPVLSTVFLNPLEKMVISAKCAHPEAVYKMVNLAQEFYWGAGDLAKHWTTVKNDPKYADIIANIHLYPIELSEPPTLNYDLVKEVTDAVNAKNPDMTYTEEGRNEVVSILKYLDEGDRNGWGLWRLRVGADSGTGVSNMRLDAGHYIVSEFYGSPGPVQTERGSTLEKMEKEAFTKIIMNEVPVSEFDTFVQQWKASGGDDLMAEINAWYDENK